MSKNKKEMTLRQCEIAAESYAASLLSQAGCDVLVQYGANQPHYDLVAAKDNCGFAPISVKGSQDGGWMVAVKYKKKGVSWNKAIDEWLEAQRDDIIFLFVQFIHAKSGEAPRAYLARPLEIADHMKTQHDGTGYGCLHEDYKRDSVMGKYNDKTPDSWLLTKERIASLIKAGR